MFPPTNVRSTVEPLSIVACTIDSNSCAEIRAWDKASSVSEETGATSG
jgi:hypothetical protein